MKKVKNLILGAIIGSVITGVVCGVFFNKNEKIKIEKVKTELNGDIIGELTDGSFYIINENENLYIFQPSELGDWNYDLKNSNEVEKIVKTYIEIKNNGSY